MKPHYALQPLAELPLFDFHVNFVGTAFWFDSLFGATCIWHYVNVACTSMQPQLNIIIVSVLCRDI